MLNSLHIVGLDCLASIVGILLTESQLNFRYKEDSFVNKKDRENTDYKTCIYILGLLVDGDITYEATP